MEHSRKSQISTLSSVEKCPHSDSLKVKMLETGIFQTLNFLIETVLFFVPLIPVPAVQQVKSSVLLDSLNYMIFLPPPQTMLC